MRVLFVTPNMPSSRDGRASRLIHALAEQGHTVTLAVLGSSRDAEGEAETASVCEAVHVAPHTWTNTAVGAALSFTRGAPAWAGASYSPPLAALIQSLTAQQRFDIVHVERLQAAHFTAGLQGRLPLVLDAGQCLTDWQVQRMEENQPSAVPRIFQRMQLAALSAYELRMASGFDRILVTSEHAADALARLRQARGGNFAVDVVPNGVDLDEYQPATSASQQNDSIVFAGGMRYDANRRAALKFCREVFPIIRKQHTGAILTLIGDAPPAEMRIFERDRSSGVEWANSTDDVRPLFAQASAVVCPLGVDGRGKVLEVMAMGKALVASTQACREIQRASRQECVRAADTPLAYATQLLHLLQTPSEAERLGTAARKYMETWHNWNVIACRITALYEDAIAAFNARSA